jgi:hypothetical protein
MKENMTRRNRTKIIGQENSTLPFAVPANVKFKLCKMAFRFAPVTDKRIFALNETTVLPNTKKVAKYNSIVSLTLKLPLYTIYNLHHPINEGVLSHLKIPPLDKAGCQGPS